MTAQQHINQNINAAYRPNPATDAAILTPYQHASTADTQIAGGLAQALRDNAAWYAS